MRRRETIFNTVPDTRYRIEFRALVVLRDRIAGARASVSHLDYTRSASLIE